ncbi:hypothetical protein EJB05_47966, partial [Eragrostis curvula]
DRPRIAGRLAATACSRLLLVSNGALAVPGAPPQGPHAAAPKSRASPHSPPVQHVASGSGTAKRRWLLPLAPATLLPLLKGSFRSTNKRSKLLAGQNCAGFLALLVVTAYDTLPRSQAKAGMQHGSAILMRYRASFIINFQWIEKGILMS